MVGTKGRHLCLFETTGTREVVGEDWKDTRLTCTEG